MCKEDMDSVWVLVIAVIGFLFYKLIDQNNKMSLLKWKTQEQIAGINSRAVVPSPANQTVAEPVAPKAEKKADESSSDDELVNMVLESAARAVGVTSTVPRSRARRINIIQNIQGPSNNNNLRLNAHIDVQPILGGGGGFGGALSGAGMNFLSPASSQYEYRQALPSTLRVQELPSPQRVQALPPPKRVQALPSPQRVRALPSPQRVQTLPSPSSRRLLALPPGV